MKVRVMQSNANNCMEACLATLFDAPLSAIPQLPFDANWVGAVRTWAKARGYGFVTIAVPDETVWRDAFSDGYLICAGQSARGRLHAVIYKDGELWHDPHPESSGIKSVEQVDFFYPLNGPGETL